MSYQDAPQGYLTVSKKNLLSRWLVDPTVTLTGNDAIFGNSFEIDNEISTLEKVARFRIATHGSLKQISSKHVSDTGVISYKVRWNDGTWTEEDPRVLQKIDEKKVLAFEAHDVEINEESEGDASDDISYVARSTRIRRQKKQPHEHQKQHQKQQKEQQKQMVSLTPTAKKSGPFQVIPYYRDIDFVDIHWKQCSKCQRPGYPNGTPVQKQRKTKNNTQRSDDEEDEDDVLLLSSDEEREVQGRLLLCITCSAATHEGCLSDRTKRCLRQCVKSGETTTEYQCSSCLQPNSDTEKCCPPCRGCHQVHFIANLTLLPNKKAPSPIPEATDGTLETLVGTADTDDTENTIVNEADTVDPVGLFRCSSCTRGFHYTCLPQFPEEHGVTPSQGDLVDVCRKRWKCAECITYTRKPEQIITWRIAGDPADKKLDITLADAASQSKEFLVRWHETSYRHLSWVSESWIMHAVRNLFARYIKRVSNLPHVTESELVPETWKNIERILTAQDKNGGLVEQGSENRIARVLVKFFDLSYDEACWDDPPSKEKEPERYASFMVALSHYQRACRVRVPEQMKERVEDVRLAASRENYGKHEIKKQPDFITGGTLMPHQLDGLNWLTYQWEKNLPCILADDMGLGKTIQIVSFLNYLLRKFAIYPFLIVVPNSTASNWLREFAKWAPNMVVVPYYGSSKSRRLSREHELLRGGGPQAKFRCHAVVLTYESANSDISFLSKVRFWPALIVDEAQRLKNDSTQLFQKLKTLKWDHTVLMTGTPLQNNMRELINIMHFVDPKKFSDVEGLEEKYSELTKEVVQELHEQLKPYFLRRTKEMVLKTLPPKSEIIVPVTMTTLQKEVCRNIMKKNLVSFAALSGEKTNRKSKKGLANILMQLRKALNHPYLIPDIEVKQGTPEATQRVLVEASSKLRVLDQMLPKLIKDGHRILIFSTLRLTLDVLEDYFIHEEIKYERLDGMTSNFERVKSIDAFNATDSDVKVFLLTTKAGGVGINLATADTVIMWDFDFNPHSDMQAISRAYRIGQTKPVLVLKFMTRFSVEEKIAQKAKKKMVLDHLVVDKMDEDELEENDVESILKFGAQALFEDEDDKEISYDSSAIDKLLDRSKMAHVEEQNGSTTTDTAKPMTFSFAKVWSHDTDAPTEELAEEGNEVQEKVENDFWNKFLQEKREELETAMSKTEELGRGARKRATVRYFDPSDTKTEKVDEDRKSKRKGKKKQEKDMEVDDVYVDRPDPPSEDELNEDQQVNVPPDNDSTIAPAAQPEGLKVKRRRGKAAISTDGAEPADPSQSVKKRRRRKGKNNEQPLDPTLINQQQASAGFDGQHQKRLKMVYFTPPNGGDHFRGQPDGIPPPGYWNPRPPYLPALPLNHPYYLQHQGELRNMPQQQQPMVFTPAQYPPSGVPPTPPIHHYTHSYSLPPVQPHGEHQRPYWSPTQPGSHRYPYPSNLERSAGPISADLVDGPQVSHGSAPISNRYTGPVDQLRPTEESVDPIPQMQLRDPKAEILRHMIQAIRLQQGWSQARRSQDQREVPLSMQNTYSPMPNIQAPERNPFAYPMTSFAATQALMNPSLAAAQGQAIASQQTNVTLDNNNKGIHPIPRFGPEKVSENTRELLSTLDLNRGDLTKAPHMQIGPKMTTINSGIHPVQRIHSLNTSVEAHDDQGTQNRRMESLNIPGNPTRTRELDMYPISEPTLPTNPQSASENNAVPPELHKPRQVTQPSSAENDSNATMGGPSTAKHQQENQDHIIILDDDC